MNTESINLTENPLDFMEPYFTKKTLVALAAREMGHVSSENIGRRIAIRRSGTDRDVNFAKKPPNFVKMNTESINLTENPSDFVEPYFTKKILNF